jgi:hypothetical protein
MVIERIDDRVGEGEVAWLSRIGSLHLHMANPAISRD